jgi:hypothetical protein
MKSVILALASMVVLGTFPAQARLGETPPQISKRYGTPSLQQFEDGRLYGLPSTNYVFKGVFVSVTFKDGKSVREAVSPLEARELTLKERDAFVKAIGGPKFGKSADGKLWVGPDAARAVYLNGMLRIQSGQFTKYWEAYERDRKEKAGAQTK